MANALVTNFKASMLVGTYDLSADTVKAMLIDTADDSINTSTDDFYDDLTAAAIEENATLASKTTTGGTFDSADVTFSAASGDPCEHLALWIDTAGAASTDPLLANYDTFTSGMPVTLNGGDVNVTVHASGWFAL